MSNAMRFGKRTLAGVAAGALALGALTIASAPAASAGKTIKPKAGTAAATVYAVRSSGTSTSAINLPAATMTWPSGYGSLANNTAGNTVDLTTAPTAGAKLYYGADDTVTLNTDDTLSGVDSGPFTTADDSIWEFRVDTAGTYVGRIYNGTDTVTFTFATAGAPTSMSLAPATQTVLVGAQADLELTLLDASGKATQPQIVDSVSLSRSPTDDTLVTIDDTDASGGAISSLSSAELSTGSALFSLNTSPTVAGTTTVTATPAGTLTGSGVTAQSAAVVKSGTVATNSVSKFTVTTPSNAFNSNATVASSAAQVPVPTTTLSITIDDTTAASAGNKIRKRVVGPTGAVINGGAATASTPLYVDLTTDASKQAKLDLTLGGTALNVAAQIVVTQVNVIDAPTTVPTGAALTVTQTQASVQSSNIVPSPETALTKIGNTTAVTVQVDDSFGVDQAGWTVRAYRSSTLGSSSAGTLLATATTNSSGSASLSVSALSTVVNNGQESYFYTATAPVGGSAITATKLTTVTYTTSGNLTSLSVAPGSGTPCSTTSCTVTAYGAVRVASAGIVSNTASTSTQAVSTGTVTAGTVSNMIQLVTTTSPSGNPSVVTVPEGLKVSATAPNGTTTLWSSGAQTATVGANAYIWATKTGTHDVKVESGGLSVTVKIHVYNTAADAYNIVLTPAKQDLATGAFGTGVLTVTDAFGNVVDTTDDSGAVAMSVTGQVLFGGYTNAIASATTGTAGTYTATLIAGNTAGAAVITAVPKTSNGATAWQTGYTKPTGFAAPVTSATAEVTVTAASSKSISIVGSRTTVSGKPGISIVGVTTGFDNGKTVIPYFRFPGETTYTEGSARPVITDGEFVWERKTGKKFYAYVTSDDGAVMSNRVIIPAN